MAVVPAKAGIHFRFWHQGTVDARFRGHDGGDGDVLCGVRTYGTATPYQRKALAPSAQTDVRQRAP
jgi:hypothetical protein